LRRFLLPFGQLGADRLLLCCFFCFSLAAQPGNESTSKKASFWPAFDSAIQAASVFGEKYLALAGECLSFRALFSALSRRLASGQWWLGGDGNSFACL